MTPEEKETPVLAHCGHFQLPALAREQELTVYRFCPTGKLERQSFLSTYEQNRFCVSEGADPNDPREYSMSVNASQKALRYRLIASQDWNPPGILAKGVTNPLCGPCCLTFEWVRAMEPPYPAWRNKNARKKGTHIDWWLYEGAQPWNYFEVIANAGEDPVPESQ